MLRSRALICGAGTGLAAAWWLHHASHEASAASSPYRERWRQWLPLPRLSSAQAQSLNRRLGGDTTVLSVNEWTTWKLVQTHMESTTAKRFLFEPVQDAAEGITVATSTPVEVPPISCVMLRARVDEVSDEVAVRPYNPITPRFSNGSLAFVIREYADGKLSPRLHELRPGDIVEMKGPFEQYRMTADEHAGRDVVLIAGGTGVTPCYQLIQDLVRRRREGDERRLPARLLLVFANNSELEILMRQDIEALAESSDGYLQIQYVVKEAPLVPAPNITHGLVTREYLQRMLPPPERDPFVLVCGPPGMMEAVSGPKTKDRKQGELSGALKALGYREAQVWKL